MFVCVCHAISDKKVLDLIHQGYEDEREIEKKLGIGTHCGSCRPEISKIIKELKASCAA